MVKVKKRLQLFSILLAACLLAVSLIGCSSGGTDDAKDNVNETADSTDSTEDAATEEVPDVYYEGFRLVEFSGQTSEETYKEIQDYITEQTGVKPVPVELPRGSETEKLNLLISSADERLDVIMTGDWQDYAEKGIIMPLNDLIDKYGPNIKKAWSEYEYMWDMVSDDEGTIWALPRSLPTTSYPTWIRKDWLDKYGLEMPTTLEEFENILRTFKENDPAGNGQTIPLLTDLGGVYNAFSAGFTEHG